MARGREEISIEVEPGGATEHIARKYYDAQSVRLSGTSNGEIAEYKIHLGNSSQSASTGREIPSTQKFRWFGEEDSPASGPFYIAEAAGIKNPDLLKTIGVIGIIAEILLGILWLPHHDVVTQVIVVSLYTLLTHILPMLNTKRGPPQMLVTSGILFSYLAISLLPVLNPLLYPLFAFHILWDFYQLMNLQEIPPDIASAAPQDYYWQSIVDKLKNPAEVRRLRRLRVLNEAYDTFEFPETERNHLTSDVVKQRYKELVAKYDQPYTRRNDWNLEGVEEKRVSRSKRSLLHCCLITSTLKRP